MLIGACDPMVWPIHGGPPTHSGKSSDISYYLNSHHIDLHAWSMQGKATPKSLTASGATGVADGDEFKCPKGTEDTITLVTDWENTGTGNIGILDLGLIFTVFPRRFMRDAILHAPGHVPFLVLVSV